MLSDLDLNNADENLHKPLPFCGFIWSLLTTGYGLVQTLHFGKKTFFELVQLFGCQTKNAQTLIWTNKHFSQRFCGLQVINHPATSPLSVIEIQQKKVFMQNHDTRRILCEFRGVYVFYFLWNLHRHCNINFLKLIQVWRHFSLFFKWFFSRSDATLNFMALTFKCNDICKSLNDSYLQLYLSKGY